MKKTCAYRFCGKKFSLKGKPHNARFCSVKCRWSENNLGKRERSKKLNLCYLCEKNPRIKNEKNKELTYCSECQKYFKDRYQKRKGEVSYE